MRKANLEKLCLNLSILRGNSARISFSKEKSKWVMIFKQDPVLKSVVPTNSVLN